MFLIHECRTRKDNAARRVHVDIGRLAKVATKSLLLSEEHGRSWFSEKSCGELCYATLWYDAIGLGSVKDHQQG